MPFLPANLISMDRQSEKNWNLLLKEEVTCLIIFWYWVKIRYFTFWYHLDWINHEITSFKSILFQFSYTWIIPFNYITIDIANVSNVTVSGAKRTWLNMTDGKLVTFICIRLTFSYCWLITVQDNFHR